MSILVGDCVELMAAMPAASVDAVVTDPPYELGFMGKSWDRAGVSFQPETWAEALRVLKPGGPLLAFGGTRTYHRIAVAIEDAGFDIRDQLAWLYGSGFPKSHNLAPFSIVATRQTFDGWGTALKPAQEPIAFARKPLAGTVAANVLEHGTGALNVDGCRVAFRSKADEIEAKEKNRHADYESGEVVGYHGWESRADGGNYDPPGRWPANVVLDEEAAAMLDEQTGELSPGNYPANRNVSSPFNANTQQQAAIDPGRTEAGGASRFFYVAKASRAERNAGLEGFEERQAYTHNIDGRDAARASNALGGGERARVERGESGISPARNHHPTVKPVSLMRWLVRLVTPPGGLVLDPFAGSGTTGIACALEGFAFTGLEQDADYVKIAEARIAWWAEHGEEALAIVRAEEKAEAARAEVVAAGQLGLFGS